MWCEQKYELHALISSTTFTDIISCSNLYGNSICTLFGIDIYYHLHGTWWPEFCVLALHFHCNGQTKEKCVLTLLHALTPLGRWQRLIFIFNGNWGGRIAFASFIPRWSTIGDGRNNSTRKVRLLSCKTVVHLKWVFHHPNHKRQGLWGQERAWKRRGPTSFKRDSIRDSYVISLPLIRTLRRKVR